MQNKSQSIHQTLLSTRPPLALFWATPFTKILDAPAQRGVGVKREVEFKKRKKRNRKEKKLQTNLNRSTSALESI